jgi:hypothetical protein
MKLHHGIVILVLSLLLPAVSQAGLLFGKKNKSDPKERVPELLATIKNDKDEHKRVQAANELRQFDPAAFPDLVPILIDVLFSDAKAGVRAQAAETLGKIRPVSNKVGWALEQAHEKDSSMRVRMQAKYSLLQYHWAGYKGDSKEFTPLESKQPIAETRKPIVTTPAKRTSNSGPRPGESVAPPLVDDSQPKKKSEKKEPKLPLGKIPELKPVPKDKEDGPDLGQ